MSRATKILALVRVAAQALAASVAVTVIEGLSAGVPPRPSRK